MIVKIGAFGVRNEFQIQDELLIESGDNVAEVAVGVGIEVSVEEPNISPAKFDLHQNYPNPFNPSTNIKFDLAENSHVSITIFNLVGQKVSTLVNRSLDLDRTLLLGMDWITMAISYHLGCIFMK